MKEQRNLQEALKQYFLGNEGCDLEESFQTLCGVEQKAMETADPEGEYSPHFAARTKICKVLLGNDPIYELFPDEDFRGTFEGNYDDQKWREQYYFSEPVPGFYNAREINLENPLYQAYRQTLYEKTIRQLCDDYPQEILQSLPQQEQENINQLGRHAGESAMQPDFRGFQASSSGGKALDAPDFSRMEHQAKDERSKGGLTL